MFLSAGVRYNLTSPTLTLDGGLIVSMTVDVFSEADNKQLCFPEVGLGLTLLALPLRLIVSVNVTVSCEVENK